MKIKSILVLMSIVVGSFASAQSVLDPNDPVITYDAANPPTQPAWGDVGKWVRTKVVGWNSDAYKCYIYKGMPFRLHFPKNYDTTGATKYPMIIMWHGRGESSNIYNNERSMRHGGQKHRDAISNGTYNGFVCYPQNQSGFFSPHHYDYMHELIVNEFANIHVDLNRVGVHGLSAGGSAAWNSVITYPKDYACSVPMSASSTSFIAEIPKILAIPFWQSQGGNDRSPHPATSQQVVDAALASGMHFTYTVYPNLGHGVWNTHYNEPDFFPYFQRHNKTNPLVLFRKREFCPGDTIKATLVLSPGFDAYQWRKDGVIISGADSNVYVATSLGTYDARIVRGTDTSYWSPTPVVMEMKSATITPPLQLAGNMSSVIPSPDNSPGVTLKVDGVYEEYEWKAAGTSTVLSTDATFTVTTPGDYVVSVKEEFGCSSSDSPPYTVVNGNGPNAPATPTNESATPLSKTAMSVTWNDQPNPTHNETGFELYRSTTSGSDYEFVALIDADSLSYDDENLISNTTYYYLLRAINMSGASAATLEFSGTTLADSVPPTTPTNLTVTETSANSISLRWNSSTDDAAIDKYEVYLGAYRAVVTSDTFATVYGLTQNTVYNLTVRARDHALNRSPASNQVTAAATFSGLNYSYYHGTYNSLPDFNTLTPEYTGVTPNVDISVRQLDNNFAFKWEGFIDIPVAGSYTFETYSDDGSKLYIGTTEVVNNDGLHGGRYREGTYNFPAPGPYPITITFFEKSGGQVMRVYWKNTAHGVVSREEIPDQYFGSSFTMPCCPPSAPFNLSATPLAFDKIQINWADTASNETGFQIFRSTEVGSGYVPIAILNANDTSYIDNTGLVENTTYNYQVIALGQYGSSHDASGIREDLGDINSGVGATDGRSGTGYIMFSTQSVHSRFTSSKPISSNSDHVIAVVNDNGQWKYDNNGSIIAFTPVDSDVLIATVDFSADQIASLEGTDTTINGMKVGYASGDLQYFANRWNGGFNNGEFTVQGTYFNRNVQNLVSATTFSSVGAPATPVNLVATAIATDKVELSWTDLSDNEDNFIIQRSLTPGAGFVSIDTIPANADSSASYIDSNGLYAHTTYYYQVLAKNTVAYVTSSEVNVETLNSIPTLDPFANKLMRHGSIENIAINAADADSDVIAITGVNLPSFAVLTDNGDGTGNLALSPALADTSTYIIIITASDLFGGSVNDTFELVVVDNYLPTIDSVANITMDEGDTVVVNVVAVDSNGASTLTWNTQNLPSFATFVTDTLGNGTLTITPFYADGGQYNDITIGVKDNMDVSASTTFDIVVNEKNPNRSLKANFKHNNVAPSPWKNINFVTPVSLNYDDGSVSPITTQLSASSFTTYNLGVSTGNNSGIAPDAVLKDYYYFGGFGAPNTVDLTLNGLDTGKTYNISFIGSSKWTGTPNNGHTVFTAMGQADSVNVQDNTSEAAILTSLVPDSTGKITVNMTKGADAIIGFVNGMIIEELFDPNSTPAAPKTLTASFDSTVVNLSWYDAPYNETGYNVYRSDSVNGTFTKINNSPLPLNSTSFTDVNVVKDEAYYYKVQAFNVNGNSPFSNTASILVENINLSITGIDSITIDEGASLTTYLKVQGNGNSAALTWSTTNLPSFVTLTPLTGDSARLDIDPFYADGGVYNEISFKVLSAQGDSTEHSLVITVNEINPNGVLKGSYKYAAIAPAPWTNINFASAVTLNYEDGSPSNITTELSASSFTKYFLGQTTGDNSGIVPDNVLKDYYYFGGFGAPNSVNVIFNGLDTANAYDLSFISSSKWTGTADNGHTVFSANGQTDSCYAHNNTTDAAELTALRPDSTGKIVVSATKAPDAIIGYINGLIVEEHFNYGAAPDAARLLAAEFSGDNVELNWYDAPYNETGYNVFRSDSLNGTYVMVNTLPIAANSTSYTDETTAENGDYYYKIKAINDFGESGFSNVATPEKTNVAPEITISGDSVVQFDSTGIMTIAATDINGGPISLSAAGLPSFASLQDNGNGNGTITITPTNTDKGFHTFNISAKDESDLITTKSVTIEVIENILFTVRVNFNQYPNASGPAPWNNMDRAPVSGDSLVNLVDGNNTATGIDMYLQTGFGGVFNRGAQTGDNSGIVPDKVLKEYYWFGAFGAPGQTQLRVGDLDNTKKYRFKFVGSSVFDGANITDNGETNYTIGNQTVAVDVQGNTSTAGTISDVIADNNGDVIIDITKGTGALVGYINAMIIEVMPGDPTAFDPKDLTAAAISSSAIELNWSDNSFDETSFIIERNTTGMEIDFTPIDTVPANTVNYTDTGLASSVYYYRVRGTKTVGYTAYSNVAYSGTIAYSVYININGDAQYDAPAPWNNLTVAPFDDDVYKGFRNDLGVPTGMEMIWLKAMQGSNDWGTSTGNDSGIYPDSVLRSFFFNDAFDPAGRIKLTNMSQQYTYNFKFLGSIKTGFNIFTDFTVDGRTVSNSQTYNTTEAVSISNVASDINNEIEVTVQETSGSNWAIFNAMVIEAVNAPAPSSLKKKSLDPVETSDAIEVRYGQADPTISVFPNPLEGNNVNIGFKDATYGTVTVTITDLMGRTVSTNEFDNTVLNGIIKLDLSDDYLNKGMYIVRVQFADSKVRTSRLIKL